MVVRDTDVLQELTRRAGCTVYVSVPTVDEDAWSRLEPGTAHPMQRLRAVRQLNDAGVRAGVLMNPIVPGITSKRSILERTVKAIAGSGAAFVGCNVMFLEGGTRDHFMRWLGDAYPQLVDGYAQLYARKYAPAAYRKEVSQVIGMLRARYGVSRREDEDRGGPASPQREAEQQMIRWKE
jgi:DNA repair photolyase